MGDLGAGGTAGGGGPAAVAVPPSRRLRSKVKLLRAALQRSNVAVDRARVLASVKHGPRFGLLQRKLQNSAEDYLTLCAQVAKAESGRRAKLNWNSAVEVVKSSGLGAGKEETQALLSEEGVVEP